jgi:single-stranded DNA-binding protein
MNALRNKVQLIGHVGNDPEIKILKEEKISQFYISD